MNFKKIYEKRWFRIGSALGILGVGISTMVLLAATKEESKKRDIGHVVRQVEVSELNFGEHTLQVHGNGSIVSQNSLDLVSFVGGQVIYSKENLKSGLFVKRGDILLRIDDREALNRTHQARSGLINAIVSLIPNLKDISNNSAHQKWNKYLENLDMDRTPDLPEINDAQERIRVSMHNVFNQFSMVRNSEINLDRHTIRAPFDAYLVSDGVIPGAWMSPGQRIANLIDPFHLEISVPLAVSELELISGRNNPKASIRATEDHSKRLDGILKRKNAHIDRNSQTVMVHVELVNDSLDPAFLPGNYMDVYIEGNRLIDVDLLPRDVVAPGPFVYTLEDSILGKRAVTVLATQGDSLVIARDNLDSGDLVVTTLLQRPIVGMRIATAAMVQEADSTLVNL